MKSTTLFTPITFFLLLLTSPLLSFTVTNDSNSNKLKEFIESKEVFKKFKKEAGFPIWDKAIIQSFNNDKLTIVPFIDYENSYVNGLFFHIDNGSSMKYKFISRKELEKQYINKNKSKKLPYYHSLIASFLKFDLSMYNFLERTFSQEIDLTKGSEADEIKVYKFGVEMLQFVHDK